MTPSAQMISEHPPASRSVKFKGAMFGAAAIADLARPHGPAGLAGFVAPSPSQKHTSNERIQFAAEAAMTVAVDLALDPRWFDFFAQIGDVEALVGSAANSAAFAELSQWVSHLHGARTKEIAEITETLSLLLDRLDVDGYAAMAKDLDMVDVEKSHPYHLLAILRALFNQRHALASWRGLEQRTRAKFDDLKLNPAKVMKGLDADDTVRPAER